MIGIDRATGRTISGFEQFVSRVVQVLTTPIGSREHRRGFGSRVPETLAQNMGDDLLMLAQAHALDAFYNETNGLSDFTPSQVLASRGEKGLTLQFAGQWKNKGVTFEVSI